MNQELITDWKFRRGDIYYAHLDDGVGSEQNGDRPVIIIQNDVGNRYSPTLIVASLTSRTKKKANQPTHCLINSPGLAVPSVVQTEQVFTIDKKRIFHFMGRASPEEMQRIDDALKASLALNPVGGFKKPEPIIRSPDAYAPPGSSCGPEPVYPYTVILTDYKDIDPDEASLYMNLHSAVQALIQRFEHSFTFYPSLLSDPRQKKQVTAILTDAENYLWRIKEELK